MDQNEAQKNSVELNSVVIRFAGDSGDGMQVTGSQFSNEMAFFGNDLATLPDYPAEIRAPAGSVGGVSAYQLQFSDHEIFTPGDELDTLVVMNAAALKANIEDLKSGGYLFADISGFNKRNLELAGYETNPLEDTSLRDYRVIQDDFTSLTVNALQDMDITSKNAKRCKNFFTMGMVFWLYHRGLTHTERWLKEKFAKKPLLAEANIMALNAGYNYANTVELFSESYNIRKADLPKGKYRKVSGNEAVAMGLVTASKLAERDLVFCSYPITPASDVLHELARFKNYGVKTFQAEDEIAAACSAIGASFAGSLGVTSTSGPGLALKSEAINLAVISELPLVVVDVQRGGPSTGLPTKTEQSDLNMAVHGRNGDSPLVVLAASSPADSFWMSIEAARLATQFMTPVILLTDGYIGNGTEPLRIPSHSELPDLKIPTPEMPEDGQYKPFARDPETLARPWASPGTPGLEHRIGGLEKEAETGNVSYDPLNHQKMTNERMGKIQNIENFIPNASLYGDADDELLILSWGGTKGALQTAVDHLKEEGFKVASCHLNYINPFPRNLGHILESFDKILVAELNTGQLRGLIGAHFGVKTIGLNKVQGRPFKLKEIKEACVAALSQKESDTQEGGEA